ncbi:hypothetical protein Asi03nite_14350 [Actinoplanes siamensis]|uniref:Uncharacterized protein n=1 Tax=Actinoplanes siamensis TaxID=1223317 RepID=A0A919N3Z0_9ACTN|nr:hypothetical protein Asi03nite_14350 [Actinoplanes siamensis]
MRQVVPAGLGKGDTKSHAGSVASDHPLRIGILDGMRRHLAPGFPCSAPAASILAVRVPYRAVFAPAALLVALATRTVASSRRAW